MTYNVFGGTLSLNSISQSFCMYILSYCLCFVASISAVDLYC